ncbi:hypothetical protein [Sphingomonas sp. MMS24-J13]|uniref:hypothetical protein n=1 Tax=Sphingomonas sp. MMS24-J13 TaxID=3238686 RepID=UPI00384B0103
MRIENSTNVTITNVSETCPRCGGRAKLQDGTYDFIGAVLAAVRAPGVMRQDILEFQAVAKAVQAGEISSEEAVLRFEKLNDNLSKLWSWINENGAALAILLAIITIYLTIWAKDAADAGSAQAHADAQQQWQATQTQTQLQQKIYEVLQRQTASSAPGEQRSLQVTIPYHQAQTPTLNAPQNRKARRAAASRKRHQL